MISRKCRNLILAVRRKALIVVGRRSSFESEGTGLLGELCNIAPQSTARSAYDSFGQDSGGRQVWNGTRVIIECFAACRIAPTGRYTMTDAASKTA